MDRSQILRVPSSAPEFDRHVHILDGERLPVLVWRFDTPRLVVASGPFGGGLGERHWVVNAQVPPAYRADPAVHLEELAPSLGLEDQGVGMLTAVDLARVQRGEDGGVRVYASVGITHPTWAADENDAVSVRAEAGWAAAGTTSAGTINIVAFVPERLSPAALVNAVATATEAKSQAIWEKRIPATGTASDALCIACPVDGEEHAFGGPRSRWGARLARAVHQAVAAGLGEEPRS